MSKFSVWPCASPTFLEMDKCFRDGLHLAVGLWGQHSPAPHSALHPWAHFALEDHKCLQKIQEGKSQSYSTSDGGSRTPVPLHGGMIQVNHLEEIWRNKSMLEHSNCIFTWPVLRWRMILHSQFWESLPKCSYHIKDSVPFFYFILFFFLSFRVR